MNSILYVYTMNITSYLTDCILTNTPIAFSKYGDGELICADSTGRTNADFENYTPFLRNGIINAFKYMVNEADNAYIGQWHDKTHISFWEMFAEKPIKWAYFHSLLIDNRDMIEKDEILMNKVILYKTIKQSPLKKIIICNPLLVKSQFLLNIDHVIHVPFRNWIDTHMDECIDILKQLIKEDGNHIVMTCCGIASRILLPELIKIFPKGIYLDFGSGLDLICTKRDSRGHGYSYEDMAEVLKDLLPADWEDEKYNEIYKYAKVNMGVHLPN